MTTLTLDEVKILRKGYSMPKALDDSQFIMDHDDFFDFTKFSDETTDDNSNDDQFFDG